ncbi:hypothetical protein MBLNU230_g6787t1 [Neophaeotheca triangularis]
MSKSNQKDMRRADLIVPQPDTPDSDSPTDVQSTMASTLPMAAIFTRNKMIGWTAVIFSLQGWLSETPAQKAAASTPSYMSFGMALMSVGVAYMPLFMPPQGQKGMAGGTNTGPVPA